MNNEKNTVKLWRKRDLSNWFPEESTHSNWTVLYKFKGMLAFSMYIANLNNSPLYLKYEIALSFHFLNLNMKLLNEDYRLKNYLIWTNPKYVLCYRKHLHCILLHNLKNNWNTSHSICNPEKIFKSTSFIKFHPPSLVLCH